MKAWAAFGAIVCVACGATEEEPDPPPPPEHGTIANGELCTNDIDCSSDDCAPNQVGEHRCYGTAAANSSCADTYDCALGLCVSPHYTINTAKVCASSVVYCEFMGLSDECVTAAILNAQRWNDCGKMTTLFDACLSATCERIKANSENCTTLLQNLTNPAATCATLFP